MRWGHRKAPDLSGIKTRAERTAYSVGANLNPREAKYKVRKIVNRVNDNVESLANLTSMSVKLNGTLPTNQKALKAVESVGINAHKKAVYKNLDHNDLKNLKTYTDSARYSRSVNGFLAIGIPKEYAAEAAKLKKTIQKKMHL